MAFRLGLLASQAYSICFSEIALFQNNDEVPYDYGLICNTCSAKG